MPNLQFLSLPSVLEKTSISRASVYNFMREGSFPKQINLGARKVGWLNSEIETWIAERVAASRQEVKK